MNTEVRQDAKAMLELLSNRDHWTQGVYARDADGHSVDPVDPTAVCWCAVGAVHKVTGSSARALPGPRLRALEYAIVAALRRRPAAHTRAGYLITVNDSANGYDTVMRALREIVGEEAA